MTTFGATITGPFGTLDLEAGPYELERSHAEERRVSWRKTEVSDDYVEDTFVLSAVREAVTEPVAVWVTATTQSAMQAALDALTACFEQLQYTMTFTVDGVTQQWKCKVAEYSVRTEQAFQHAHTALVKAQVPRSPRVVLL